MAKPGPKPSGRALTPKERQARQRERYRIALAALRMADDYFALVVRRLPPNEAMPMMVAWNYVGLALKGRRPASASRAKRSPAG